MDDELRDQLGEVMREVLTEYEQEKEPFGSFEGELSKALDEINSEQQKALFKTLSTALNYQTNADAHYRRFGQLWKEQRWLFKPEVVVEQKDLDDIRTVFQEYDVHMYNQNAKIWSDLCLKLYEDYNSNPLKIFEEAEYDFDEVEQIVRRNTLNDGHMNPDFPFLRGSKIRPLWLRFMRSQISKQTGFENTEVAVDTHIISITNKLLGTEYSETPDDKEAIREFWHDVCEPQDINPIRLDFPLWLINRDWNDWGEEYLREKLEMSGIELRGIENV